MDIQTPSMMTSNGFYVLGANLKPLWISDKFTVEKNAPINDMHNWCVEVTFTTLSGINVKFIWTHSELAELSTDLASKLLSKGVRISCDPKNWLIFIDSIQQLSNVKVSELWCNND